jgi:hypothetical protein
MVASATSVAVIGAVLVPAGDAVADAPGVRGVDPGSVPPLGSAPAVGLTGPAPTGVFLPAAVDGASTTTSAPASQDPARGLRKGFDPASSTLVSRDEFSDVYLNADGTHSTVLSGHAQNVQQADGSWLPSTTTVAVDVDGGGVTTNHPLQPKFAPWSDQSPLMRLKRGPLLVGFSLVGASHSR